MEQYIDYKNKYFKIKNNQIGGGKTNFIIIHNIRGSLDYIPELKIKLRAINKKIYEFKFPKKFNLDDLSFESISNNIKKFIDKKISSKSNNIIICLEESAPYGLFFADKYPDYCKAIICYPLRLNTQSSLDRLYYKYINKNGWKYFSSNYDPINYFFKINDEKLNELFKKNGNEEKNIIELLRNLIVRTQHDKIPKIYKIPTYIFSRLDMDSVSTIEANFERKEIADMKGILSPDDAIYTSMMWNIARVQYDKEILELNKDNNFLTIHHYIEFDNFTKLIINAVKILLYK